MKMKAEIINKFKIFLLILLGLFIPGLIIWKNSFPIVRYTLNKADVYKVKIIEKKINDERYLVLSPDTNYFFNEIKLKLYFKEQGLNEKRPIGIDMTKDYEENIYPIKREIVNKEDLKKELLLNNPSGVFNGTLFSYGDAVYFISQGEYFPILDAKVFENLGFYWENVKPLNVNDLEGLSEGEKINYITPHPIGTIFKTANQEYSLVGQNERILINGDDLAEVWPDYNWVNTDNLETDFIDQCSSNIDKDGEASCKFVLDNEEIGNSYVFKINNNSDELLEAEAKLKVSKRLENQELRFKMFLKETKNRLFERYAKYF